MLSRSWWLVSGLESRPYVFLTCSPRSIGTETTATALSGLTYLLHQDSNRHALDKLKAEVRGSFSTFEDITLDSLARLEYMHAVIQEGLRMYPPVSFLNFKSGGN